MNPVNKFIYFTIKKIEITELSYELYVYIHSIENKNLIQNNYFVSRFMKRMRISIDVFMLDFEIH